MHNSQNVDGDVSAVGPREYAVAYAARGWQVFPLRKHHKTPATRHGLKDATSTLPDDWFQNGENIGLATGVSCWVLDIDVEKSGAETLAKLEKEYGRLPDTLKARTRNGGWHMFFRPDDRVGSGVSVIGPGLDHRGRGGYVVIEPSVVPADVPNGPGTYRFEDNDPLSDETPLLAAAPEWLIELTLKKRVPLVASGLRSRRLIRLIRMNLETAVGHARVCVRGVVWQGATTQHGHSLQGGAT